MKNKYYTAFIKKPLEPIRLETCLIETEDKEKFKKAIERAKKQWLEITRVYTPETVIVFPDFTKCINI